MMKYKLKKGYALTTAVSILLIGGLLCCRYINNLYPNIVLLPMPILSHISNFCISFLIILIVGLVIESQMDGMKSIRILVILLSIINLVFEGFVPIFNTPDILDGFAGFIGTQFAYLFLIILHGNGWKKRRDL